MRSAFLISVATPALAPAHATTAAAAATAAASDDTEAEPIVVTGIRDARVIGTATRTDTPVRDVPQAISIVGKQQIDDAALRSVGDVLRYVPGALIGQGEGHRDQVTLRGNSSTADFFVDGLRDDVQYYRGLYNVERVEVLKGPNAMIFGRGGGGGVVNRVSKTPEEEAFARGAASANSFGSLFVEADVNQPLGSHAAARLNAVYEEFDTHRDVYRGDRLAINPTLAVRVGPDTRAGLSYEYATDDRVVDRGIPSFAGRPLTGVRDRFFGAPDVNASDFDAHVVRADLSHGFGGGVTLTSKLLFGDYDKAYQNAFAATAVTFGAGGAGGAGDASGAGQVGIEAYRDETARRNLFSQNDLVARVDLGGMSHVLLVGVEYGDQSTRNARTNGFFDSAAATTSAGRRTIVALADPLVIPAITFRSGTGNRAIRSDADVLAVYAQDQVTLGDAVEVVAGLRYDRFRLGVADRMSGATFDRTDESWSPRLGLILHPVTDMSLYASYAKSFLPQSGDQFLSLDASLETLKPERFTNYEVGAKWEPVRGVLLTAAAYRLDRSNSRAPGAVAGTTVLTGEQRSQGIELEASGRIGSRLRVNAGYALQKAEIRTATAAAPAGRDVPLVPRHQASFWGRYDFTPRLGLGVGAYHQSRVFASIGNAVTLPRYTRIDAALFVALTPAIDAQVNVENIAGETYYPTAHNDNNITTGSPRNIRGTVRFRY